MFDKLEISKEALGGKVFDVLGELSKNASLKNLLIDAIRYGESPSNAVFEKMDGVLDTDHIKEVLKRNTRQQHMSLEDLYAVKEEMEKAEARKLQPTVRAFFTEAFENWAASLTTRAGGMKCVMSPRRYVKDA